jgi:4-amino-4-deoxy-L-arabinose transferase-like glycosyltransferase
MASVNVPDPSTVAAEAQSGSAAPAAGTVSGGVPVHGSRAGDVVRGVRERLHPLHLALIAVLALAGVLDLHRLAQNGYANIFYSAAVRSELHSLHNFLYLSSDPAGFISVDKTPLGVWLQVASAKLFGFTPMSLLVPEAVVGMLAVLLMYGVVARRFGRLAGVGAALALAVFPSFVAVARDNGPDPLLILFMLMACGAGLRAVETSRLRWLIASALAVGLAFNTKGLAALLVVPGIALAYLVCADGKTWRRVVHLLAAGLVMVVLSGAWIAFVDLSSAAHRPYVGGSTDNSEVNLTFQYNGVGRVGGQVGGPGRVPHVLPLRPSLARALSPVPRIPRVGRARYPTAFGGSPRVTRLFGIGLGDQGGWFLPFAAVGLVAIALTLRRRRDPRLAFLLVLGGWFAAEAILLSFSKGIVHPYYMSALGPGAAALAGAGVAAMAQLVRERRWLAALPALAAAGTLVVELILMRREHWYQGLVVPLAVAAAAAVVAMAVRRRWSLPATAALLGLMLVAPGLYSATVWGAPVQGTFPAAGPHATAGHGGLGVTPASVRANAALLAYVRRQGTGTRLDVLTLSSDTAAPLTLLGGRAAAIGGYSGTDPTLTGPGLAALVASGQVRYLWLGGAYTERGGNDASRAAEALCAHVPSRVWLGAAGHTALPLFDCRGRASALATAGAHCPAACVPAAPATPGVSVRAPGARARRPRRRLHGVLRRRLTPSGSSAGGTPQHP